MRRIVVVVVLALALGGCGGSTTIRAGSPGPTGTTTVPAGGTSSGGQGGSVHVGRGLAVAIVLGAAIVDGIHWTAQRLRRAFGGEPGRLGEPGATESCPQPCTK